MKRLLTLCWFLLVLGLGTASAASSLDQAGSAQAGPSASPNAAAATSSSYILTAWSELGMHCMDGKDYSVFAVLPPYNTIHAQLLKRGEPPTRIIGGVTITYEATADLSGSINTSSAKKSNFWNYARPLFLNPVPVEVGLANYQTQSRVPHAMTFNKAGGSWDAIGIPTMPYDDAGKRSPYSMALVVAKDSTGKVLATARIVLPVSDEMNCKNCHASGADAAAMPKGGWANDPNPLKDAKLNILKKHDERWPVAQYLYDLGNKGWNYQSSLYKTAVDGTPVLCSACHSDNALSLPGLPGIRRFHLTCISCTVQSSIQRPTPLWTKRLRIRGRVISVTQGLRHCASGVR